MNKFFFTVSYASTCLFQIPITTDFTDQKYY